MLSMYVTPGQKLELQAKSGNSELAANQKMYVSRVWGETNTVIHLQYSTCGKGEYTRFP